MTADPSPDDRQAAETAGLDLATLQSRAASIETMVPPWSEDALAIYNTRLAARDKAAEPSSKPRIALIVDGDDWAFANIARQVRRALAERYEFVTIPFTVVESTLQLLLMTEHYDLMHMFWREFPPTILSDWVRDSIKMRGGEREAFFQRFVWSKALTTAIYDHLYLEPEELAERQPLFAELIDGYSVGSERLRKIYEAAPGFPPPVAVLQDGVDLEMFYPQRLERFARGARDELVIGWVGNSQWNGEFEDFKGVNTILRPALDQLRAEGIPVRNHFVDKAENAFVPHNRMVHHYAEIDVYVCPSKIEGTPNPVLESMACGVPIITTDVGIVPEAFGPEQRRYILAERSIDCLKAAVRDLWTHPERFQTLSEENLRQVKAWDWTVRAANFGPFFETCLQRRDARLARMNSH